jgi:iron(III) transport system permease protein
VRWRHLDKSIFLWLLLAGVLLALVVNPLVRLLWTSFQDGVTGGFTLGNYLAAYGRWRYIEALGNSLILGVAVGVVCTIFGCRWRGRSHAPTCRARGSCGRPCSAPSSCRRT